MPEKVERKRLTEIGTTGLERQAGHVTEEFLTQLQGDRAVKVYTEMAENDPMIGAILFAVEMLIRGVTWHVDPVDSTMEAHRYAEFAESLLEDMSMSWEDTISEILSMLVYGWSYHEIVYKLRKGENKDPRLRSKFDDGYYGWRKLPIRSQKTLDRWEFDDSGGVQGMWQVALPDYQKRFIPIDKALLFRAESRRGNPEGKSVLRNAYRPWYFKKNFEEIEGIGIERDLAGMPVAWVPPELLSEDASSEEKMILESIKKIITNIRRDEQEGVVFPLAYDDNGNKMYDLQLMASAGTRQFDTESVIARYDQRISMTVMADFLLLGHEAVGSMALGVTKAQLFTSGLTAWLKVIASVFNRFALPKVFELNGFPKEMLPELRAGDIRLPDLGALSNYIQKLSATGMPLWPDEQLENHLRDMAGLPPVPPKEG